MIKVLVFQIMALTLNLGCFGQSSSKIDRKRVIDRHLVKLDSIDKMSPLSVGNGRFCYTADITGMQTFPEQNREGIPLTTMAEWGWHSFSNTGGYQLSNTFLEVDSHGKKVKYPINLKHPGSTYLRSNPHHKRSFHKKAKRT